ncbi:hypothetical protein [Cohnella mopanensis]|uniref:hypothetical protein n=1 Tax=Cohnella mopanensis TaxID=2911966 RepID=UPI001EF769D2|nr:hypothetical protein [Cohnella mopanensis]
MLLNISSLIMILLTGGYSLFMLDRRKNLLSDKSGKFYVTLVTVLVGAAQGILLVQTLEYSQLKAITIAIPVVAAFGYFAGKRFGILFSVHAILSGSVSAFAGIVFGVRFFSTSDVVFATDIVYVVLVFLLLRSIEWQSNADRINKIQSKKSAFQHGTKFIILYGVGTAAIAGAILLWGNSVSVGQIGHPLTQQAHYDEENDLQVAVIDISAAGCSPTLTEFDEGGMIKAIFHVASNASDNLMLVSSELNVEASLKQGDNVFLFNDPKPGTYSFKIGGENTVCTFHVE